ncbi:MAG: transglycosylase domain-containing protein [Chloroflexi bacterium]|nr:transglycosylase domain-containing protein [Chloroflexota bacterium]
MRRFWRKRWQRVLVIFFTGFVALSSFFYVWLFRDLPSVHSLESGLALPSTRIYDRHGRLLYEIVDLYGGSHRTVSLDDMAACLPEATIATEDANFYSHPGVDVVGVARAFWINVRGGEIKAGGSTITQQVARTLLLTKLPGEERTVKRKLSETILAVQLTHEYSRDEILELYLNQTYYGNLAYGVDAASRIYFGKSPDNLSLAECAMLAGLPQAPAEYNPLTNFEVAKERQKIVLDLMVKHDYISEDEAQIAGDEQLTFGSEPFYINAPHFVAAVWTQLEREYGDLLLSGGLEVTTTLDLDWQLTAEDIARRHLFALNNPRDGSPPKNARNAALVAIDPYTGQILTMLGNPDYFDEGNDGNVNAALALRQPGSALKPFTYAAAFNPERENPYTPASMILDIKTPFVTKKLESYTPSNFGLVEHGPVLIREALASSYNIPPVVVLDDIGVNELIDLTTRLGIENLTDSSRYDLSLTLGGGEVRLLDLAAAFAAFPNLGQRIEPVYILEIKSPDGEVIYEWEPPLLGSLEIDPRVAFLINSILSDNNARIPSFGTASPLNIGRIAAAKTGTTTDFRDNWTVGYTPNLVVGVWVGNANNTPMYNVTGVSGAGPIWNEFMRTVLDNQPELSFEVPDGLVRAQVCATSGLLPTEACSNRVWEWFIEGTVPTEEDHLWQLFEIDSRTGELATEETPEEFRTQRAYLVLPPEARQWAAREGIEPPPGDAVLVSRFGEDSEVRLLAPDSYTTFQLTPLIPYENQRILLSVVTPINTDSITYELDGEPIASLEDYPFEFWWELTPGQHELTAIATLTNGDTLLSRPVPFRVDSYVPPALRPASGPAE